MPGAAAAQSPRGEPAAPQRSMALNRLLGVLRAAGVEATSRRQQRPDEPLVGGQDKPKRPGGHDSLPKAVRSRSIMAAPGFTPYGGRTTTSIPESFSCSSRKASRMHRLMRLRSVARAACLRVTIIPSRAFSPGSRRSRKNVYPSRLQRRPWRSNRSNCAFCRSRRLASRPKGLAFAATVRAGAGPSRADWQ